MTEQQRQAWNAAVAAGDQQTMDAMRSEILDGIHTRIMDEDSAYAAAGWTPSSAR